MHFSLSFSGISAFVKVLHIMVLLLLCRLSLLIYGIRDTAQFLFFAKQCLYFSLTLQALCSDILQFGIVPMAVTLGFLFGVTMIVTRYRIVPV